jgi:hypothetical protein
MPNPVTRLAARLTRYFQNKEEAMQIALNPTSAPAGRLPDHPAQRRGGAFEPNKIAVAMMKAFLAVHGTQGAASASVREVVDTDPGRDPRAGALAPRRRHLSH